jgi:hypothetical protein
MCLSKIHWYTYKPTYIYVNKLVPETVFFNNAEDDCAIPELSKPYFSGLLFLSILVIHNFWTSIKLN